MSILIKGMEMPTDCDNCSLFDDRFDYPSCNATGHSRGYNWNPRGQRMPDCPLIEVPKHGDLIERDYVKNIIGKLNLSWEYGDGVSDCWNALMTAPTVIPTDKDGET